jgi:hypothetical protein
MAVRERQNHPKVLWTSLGRKFIQRFVVDRRDEERLVGRLPMVAKEEINKRDLPALNASFP